MKILAISDTHGFHKQFRDLDFQGVDMVIHAGDFSNQKSPMFNQQESVDFLSWYNDIPVKHKVLICGNHDTSIEAKLVNPKDFWNIRYLEHESINIEGINIFGSPYTPEFCGWAFNVRRDQLHDYWKAIPENTDILVTHSPPKGILDLAYDRGGLLEYCGDAALLRHIQRVIPKYNIFGHIHNNENNYNSGRRKTSIVATEFINASCVTDSKFDMGLTTKGLIIDYEKN